MRKQNTFDGMRFVRAMFGSLFVVAWLAEAPARTQTADVSGSSAAVPIAKRPISVQDVIQMTQVVEDAAGHVAWFSPDGSQFLVVVKRGNLERNTNDFELLRYDAAGALHSGGPELLLTMSSSSNGDAIKDVKWMRDNRTVVFLGERPRERAQVYAFDLQKKCLHALTNSAIAIESYGMSADGQELVYITKPQRDPPTTANDLQSARILPEGVTLGELLAQNPDYAARFSKGEQISLQHGEGAARTIPVDDYVPAWGPSPLLSPDGKRALIGVVVRNLPTAWKEYRDEDLQRIMGSYVPEGRPAFFVERYLVLDTTTSSVHALLDTPMVGFRPVRWSPDSRSVLLRDVYLPLDTPDEKERARRTHERFNVAVDSVSGEVQVFSGENQPAQEREKSALSVSVKQNMNLPPKIYVEDGHGNSRMLLDPNPWFAGLAFGEVETIEWYATDGHKMRGELYKPPDFKPGKRYPLVIQTHGFAPNRFWFDGPWASAFSARPLAANGMLVLQLDYDRSQEVTPGEGRREKASFEGAISELDRRGAIDRRRVGITGFSRTVYHVEYALTHSDDLFAAANLVDGIDAGYLQYLAFGPGESAPVNDGKPFGYGLAAWMANSPSFQLGRMRTPVRMQSHGLSGSVLSFWEWFALLSEMRRPVELVYLPDAPHILVKPQEKRVAQEGLVEWFRFWLKGEIDPSPEKRVQYIRWNKLLARSRTLDSATDCALGNVSDAH